MWIPSVAFETAMDEVGIVAVEFSACDHRTRKANASQNRREEALLTWRLTIELRALSGQKLTREPDL
jgi:hypothetical protein